MQHWPALPRQLKKRIYTLQHSHPFSMLMPLPNIPNDTAKASLTSVQTKRHQREVGRCCWSWSWSGDAGAAARWCCWKHPTQQSSAHHLHPAASCAQGATPCAPTPDSGVCHTSRWFCHPKQCMGAPPAQVTVALAMAGLPRFGNP